VTARTRATTNAAAGQSVRLVNLSSNKAIDAIVVGPGRATANLDHPITE
jgi:flagella basal body P-ring formation protein FlgA